VPFNDKSIYMKPLLGLCSFYFQSIGSRLAIFIKLFYLLFFNLLIWADVILMISASCPCSRKIIFSLHRCIIWCLLFLSSVLTNVLLYYSFFLSGSAACQGCQGCWACYQDCWACCQGRWACQGCWAFQGCWACLLWLPAVCRLPAVATCCVLPACCMSAACLSAACLSKGLM
jgi:hypothetical protein